MPKLLDQMILLIGGEVTVDRTVSRPWASALFQGRRHEMALRAGGVDAALRSLAFADRLTSVEWRLPGYFVADICIDAMDHEADGSVMLLSALTIEDW